MPAKISFTQKEQDAIGSVLKNNLLPSWEQAAKALKSLYDKMEKAREKESTRFSGCSVAKIHAMARDKFGDRYKTPAVITSQWTIKMQQAINQAGVTEELASKAIENCNWAGDIFAQKLIYNLAELAVVAPRQQTMFKKQAGPPAPTKKSGWLARIGDDDE